MVDDRGDQCDPAARRRRDVDQRARAGDHGIAAVAVARRDAELARRQVDRRLVRAEQRRRATRQDRSGMINIGGNQGGEAAGRAVRADLRARLGDDPAGALRIEEADRPVGVDEVEIAIAVVAAEIAHVERGEDQAADVEDRAAADDDSRRRGEQDRAAASPDAAQRIDDLADDGAVEPHALRDVDPVENREIAAAVLEGDGVAGGQEFIIARRRRARRQVDHRARVADADRLRIPARGRAGHVRVEVRNRLDRLCQRRIRLGRERHRRAEGATEQQALAPGVQPAQSFGGIAGLESRHRRLHGHRRVVSVIRKRVSPRRSWDSVRCSGTASVASRRKRLP